jgi:hypothetical protein
LRGAPGQPISARHAALLILGALALALGGCGTDSTTTPAALRLQR